MSRYSDLLKEVDGLAERLSDRYRRHLACRPGCSPCCRQHLTVFEVEAEAMMAAVRRLGPDTRAVLRRRALAVVDEEQLGGQSSCPLLLDDLCAIYSARPVICRTQGLPLLLEGDGGEPEVDFCPLNFAAPGATDDLDEGHLVRLEELNRGLVLANAEALHFDRRRIAEAGRVSAGEIILRST